MNAETFVSPVSITRFAQSCVLASCQYHIDQLPADYSRYSDIPLPVPLQKAAGKRKAEYWAGRICARTALTEWGCDAVPQYGEDRAPVWPPGFVGSITHSHGEAAAVVARRENWLAAGLDYELWIREKTANTIAVEILTPEELQVFEGLSGDRRQRFITEAFSVKESLFKALYPLTGTRFYFQDAAVVGHQRIVLLKTLSARWLADTELPYHSLPDRTGIMTAVLVPE